ncbi:MAG: stage II sporulation protein R [Firmicutes bacterium]|nr:stage II sporulation protein R [Bacillota bacterium]
MKEIFRKVRKHLRFGNLNLEMSLLVAMLLLTMSAMGSYIEGSRTAEKGKMRIEDAGILRFHVVANSDSEEDQKLKLHVRDQVLQQIQEDLAEAMEQEMGLLQNGKTLEQQRQEITQKWVASHLQEMEEWAEEAVREEGYSYEVKAALGTCWIPEKEYDGIYFPAGNYEALHLTIGEGKGQNWWCVIFPPLCLIDGVNEKEVARLEKIYGDKIVLRSRILELLRSSQKDVG